MCAGAESHIRLDAYDDLVAFLNLGPRRCDDKFADLRRFPVPLPFGEPVGFFDDAVGDTFYRIWRNGINTQSFGYRSLDLCCAL